MAAIPLMQKLVSSNLTLPTSLTAFRITVFQRILNLIPECVIPTAYLDDFLECDGPAALVRAILEAKVSACNAISSPAAVIAQC